MKDLLSIQDEQEIRTILLDILRLGLLRIRVLGWNGDADNCAIEADHLHNLPEIAREPKLESLTYYYEIERSVFIKGARQLTEFEDRWNSLGQILDELRARDTNRSMIER